MTPAIEETWVRSIVAWARAKPLILEVYLYGSRVKGVQRPESDLDVAIRIAPSDETPLTTWFYEGKEWAEELDALLDVSVHLEMMNDADKVVLPAVRDHGILVYRKTAEIRP